MADFCNVCTNKMFGDEIDGEPVEPDFDVESIAESLEPGYYTPVLCEGCGMKAVIKNEDSSVTLAFYNPDDFEGDLIERSIESWRNGSNEPF